MSDGTAKAGDTDARPRISAQELLSQLMEHHNAGVPGRTVLLVVALNRSDRLLALAQEPHTLQVLTEVARRVEALLRPGDRYSFVSHDETWVLLCDLPNVSLAELAGSTLRESLMRPILSGRDDQEPTHVTLRPVIGGAWSPGGALAEAHLLVREASDACLRAQRSDDNVLITALDSDMAHVHRGALEREVRSALHGNELDVYFQPQIQLATSKCVAVEALVRWIRPDRPAIPAAQIASVCEERGMMGQLTQYVLNSSLRQISLLRKQGIDVAVSINLSAVTLLDAAFPALVAQALATWGVSPDRLMLELTESAIVQNEAQAIGFMKQLRRQGCMLAIDDFGTGYSSFSYLKQFPLTELKIDQSFVRNITEESADHRIVRALVDLAHTFGMQALAEGVETEATLERLIELGCDRAQGFHYAPALEAHAFVDWFRQREAAATPTPARAEPAFR